MLVWLYFVLFLLFYIGTSQVGPVGTILFSLASLGFALASVVKSFPNADPKEPPATPKKSCSACARKLLKKHA